MIDVEKYWKDVILQNAEGMKAFFKEDAYVNWHCTNEHFTVDEYIRANCEYPGEWGGKVERIEYAGNLIITVTHIYTMDQTLSFHAVSFFKIENDKIVGIDEYWGDDGSAPQWRLDKQIGKPIL